MRSIQVLSICAIISGAGVVRGEPELAPPPRLAEPHLQMEKLTGGYQLILSREAAEHLRDALDSVKDGTAFTDIAKEVVKGWDDPEASAKLELIAGMIKTQAPALKKALDEKMGPRGAIIRVYGLEKQRTPKRPVLRAVGGAFIPDDVKERIKNGMTVINTTPLYWRVEGRE